MRNRLSFLNALFLMLAVGKLGHIGTLGNITWLAIWIPFIFDVIVDFLIAVGYVDAVILKLRALLIRKKISKIAKEQLKAKAK